MVRKNVGCSSCRGSYPGALSDPEAHLPVVEDTLHNEPYRYSIIAGDTNNVCRTPSGENCGDKEDEYTFCIDHVCQCVISCLSSIMLVIVSQVHAIIARNFTLSEHQLSGTCEKQAVFFREWGLYNGATSIRNWTQKF
jgi:hypothetical protein